MAEFKDILLELRKSRKFTQTELARILDVSTSTIAMWETGKRTPTRLKYEAISDLFNVDLDYLYGKTDIKRRIMYDEFGNCYTPASQESSPAAGSCLDSDRLSEDEAELLSYYGMLNDTGKKEATKRVNELAQIPAYVRKDPVSEDGSSMDRTA